MKKIYLLTFSVFLTLQSSAIACDICAIYSAVESQRTETGAIRLSIGQQFTEFNDVQDDGKHVENIGQQYLESSITQFVGAYDVSDEFGLQVNLPLIRRHFKRYEGEEAEYGTESGVGDITILARYTPYRFKDEDSTFAFQVYGGVKLPTGDSDRLKEEVSAEHAEEHEEAQVAVPVVEENHEEESHHEHSVVMRHAGHSHGIPSAIHGHDLALGSGSFDFPIGASIFGQSGRKLILASVNYVFRTEGDYSYQFADDITYSVTPAYYLSLDDEFTVAAGLSLTGEKKGKDKGDSNELLGDTGIQSVFLGPTLLLTSGRNLSGELSLDYPLDVNNTDFQSVPTSRIRFGITYRF